MSAVPGARQAAVAAPVPVPPLRSPAPFQALDAVLVMGASHASFTKTLNAEDEIFAGHYPHFPIFPGVLIYEAFAQAIRYFSAEHYLAITGVARIKSLRFLKSLYPGDTYRIDLRQVKDDAHGQIEFHMQCSCGDVPAATAVLIAGPQLAPAAPVAMPDAALEPLETLEPLEPLEPQAALKPFSVLPQRYPMLLVDRLLRLQPGQSVTAQKNVSIAEPCYRNCLQIDHPDLLAYPHSLTIESFAQSVGLLLDTVWDMSSAQRDNVVVFGSFQDVTMHGHAIPGDVIIHSVRLEHGNATSAIFSGHSSVNGKTILSCKKLIGLLLPKQSLRKEAP